MTYSLYTITVSKKGEINMKKIFQFLLTVALFIAAWKLFPESIKVDSYKTCILAAIIFYAICTGAVIVCMIPIFAIATALQSTKSVIIFIVAIIALMLCIVPISLIITMKISSYKIIGTGAFILFWIVATIFSTDINVNNKKNS